jgi:hypothetical protein
MTKHMPPVPPANRNPKGERKDPDQERDLRDKHRENPENIDEAGDVANVRQNTSNQRSG